MDRNKRKKRDRFKIKQANRQLKPRVSVFRSNKYFYAQLVEAETGNILASIDTKNTKVTPKNKKESKTYLLGVKFAENLKKKKYNKVVFDKSGYKYHGHVKNFAEGLRKGGIQL